MRNFIIGIIMAVLLAGFAFAQEEQEVIAVFDENLVLNQANRHALAAAFGRMRDGRLSAVTNIRLSMFQYVSQSYSSRDLRTNWANTGFDYRIFNIGPVDRNFFEDANITVSYETDRFGGRIAVDGGGLGGFMAWVQFTPFFRLSAGDIDAKFADSLGADPGLRVYTGNTIGTWQQYVNPDNIIGEQGLMLDFFFGPLSIGAVATTNEITGLRYSRPQAWDGEVIMGRLWEYSGRIGFDLDSLGFGELGTVNVSYNIRYESVAGRFHVPTGMDTVHPIQADAEVVRHRIGAFASLTPTSNFAVTLGWASEITRYLDEFVPVSDTVDTAWPRIFKQGLNLNARFTGIPRFTLRTDHNFSFWNDKDYTIFRLGDRSLYMNTMAAHIVEGFADVEHRILWNGFGAFFQVTDHWNVGIYARNLRRTNTARDRDDSDRDIWLVLNEFSVEPRLTWRLNENIEFFAALNYTFLTEEMSAEANRNRTPLPFPSGYERATRDVRQVFSVPLGFTMRL